MRLVAIAFGLAAALAGCGKHADDAPSCDQVADHLHQLIEGALAGHPGLDVATKQAMADQCRRSAYSPAVRRCLARAKQPAEIPTCRKLQPGAPGAAAPRAPAAASAPPVATPPAPAPSTPPAASAPSAPPPAPAAGGR